MSITQFVLPHMGDLRALRILLVLAVCIAPALRSPHSIAAQEPDPTAEEALLAWAEGRAALETGDLVLAISRFQRAVELEPKATFFRGALGNAYLDAGMINEAIAEHMKCVELDPGFAPGFLDLGVAYERKGMLAEAIRHTEYAIALLERGPQVWGLEARSEPDEVLRFSTNPSIRAFANLGYFYSLEKRWVDAYRTLMDGYDLDWTDERLIANLWYMPDQARKDLERSAKAVPDNPLAHYYLAISLSFKPDGKPDWKKVHRELDTAVKLDPTRSEFHKLRGIFLAREGKSDQAVPPLKECTERNPRQWACYSHLGGAYLELGMGDEAVIALQQALAIDSGVPSVHSQLGAGYMMQGDFGKASAAIGLALALRPGSATDLYNLAVCYMKLGQYDMATETLSSLAGRGDPKAKRLLQEIGRRAG